ncbi:hypothetical protein [Candidatus Symbiothrix dinenymphae]|nr:hypothetical protein [Candidatus Symbiothrix dinenymphae]
MMDFTILSKVQEIFRNVPDEESIILTKATGEMVDLCRRKKTSYRW